MTMRKSVNWVRSFDGGMAGSRDSGIAGLRDCIVAGWHAVRLRFRNPAIVPWCHAALAALALTLVFAPPVWAQDAGLEPSGDFNKGGRTSFQFLKIGLGARQAAMGEASIAVVQDVNSVFWNPAGIRGVESAEASFSYVQWLADMNYAAGAVGYRWDGVGVFALSVASLDYGDIPEALVTGDGNDTRTGGTFSGSDLMAGLTFSRAMTDRLSLGLTVKYLHESLFDYSANTFAFDVGTAYDLGFKGLRLAMSAQNFGGAIKYLDESDREAGYDLPLLFRIGLAVDVLGANGLIAMDPMHRLILSAEAINTNDFSERLHVGGEYWFSDFLALRAGYRMNYAEGNLSLGFGLAPSFAGMDVRLDYAYVAYEFLDAPHRFTLSIGL